MNVLAAALETELTDRGWSHTHLASLVGTTQQSVSRWVGGEVIPSRKNVISLARALGEDRSRWLSLRDQSDPEPRVQTGHPPLTPEQVAEIASIRDEMAQLTERLDAIDPRRRSSRRSS